MKKIEKNSTKRKRLKTKELRCVGPGRPNLGLVRRLPIPMTDEMWDAIEAARGTTTRAEWGRDAIARKLRESP